MRQILEDKLSILSNDELMIEAIKSLFELQIDKNKPNIQDSDDDSLIGSKYRSYELSKGILYGVIEEIKIYNKNNSKSESYNRGK